MLPSILKGVNMRVLSLLLMFVVLAHSQFQWVFPIAPASKHSSCPMEKKKAACQELCYAKNPDISLTGKIVFTKLNNEHIYLYLPLKLISSNWQTKNVAGLYIIPLRDPPLAFSFHFRAPPIS